MRTELTVMDDDCRKALLEVKREKERKNIADYCKKKADKIVAAESVPPLAVYKSSSAKEELLQR